MHSDRRRYDDRRDGGGYGGRGDRDLRGGRSDRDFRGGGRDRGNYGARDQRADPRDRRMPPMRGTKERSMTLEAPVLDPSAHQESLLCQACADAPAAEVCYNCSDLGAMYCEQCFLLIHNNEAMSSHTNKGPVLRCKRGDCSGKYASWWCSICKDVCQDCAKNKCSSHRDSQAVLIKACTKNLEMSKPAPSHQVAKVDDSSYSSSESSSYSESESSDDTDDKKERRKRKRGGQQDELVPTWGRGKTKDQVDLEMSSGLTGDKKGLQGKRIGMEPLGMEHNPLSGTKLPGGGVVGMPPPLKKYTCDYCRQDIQGQRYRCTECLDPHYDLCHQCFGTVRHKHGKMLLLFGFNCTVTTLPSSSSKRKGGRSTSPDRGGRPVSPCKKFWEGRCQEPCPWDRPHVSQDRPDHCCYICGGTGHFAKECKNRKRLEGGEAQEVSFKAEPDDNVGIGMVLAHASTKPATEEEKFARSLMTYTKLQDRIQKLSKLKKKKKLRKAGVEVSDDEMSKETLLEGLEALGPAEKSEKRKRLTTEPLEELTEEEYCKAIGAPPPKPKDELEQFKPRDIYDAAREKSRGQRIPDRDDVEREWDQEYFEHFEASLARVNQPLYGPIDTLIRKEILKNRNKHTEIMCVIESRLQNEDLSHLQALTAWFVLDAIMKQAGGYFIRDVKDNLFSLVESFLPSKRNSSWRTRCRDMLRSWRDVLARREVDKMLDVCR
eukprot:TRINITY_DN3838_c0_g3_i1.p1 TRINITY_DN3838_c0_g3~~TRINITY_DN3838_c0_g3_i1.p1  ORF type:complete len:716 (+),score=150.50 TRINITY_DN3838_c0_g3_i1:34-2181(+)